MPTQDGSISRGTARAPRALKRETKAKAESVSVAIRMPPALRTRLQRLADADGRTLSNYIARQLEKACK